MPELVVPELVVPELVVPELVMPELVVIDVELLTEVRVGVIDGVFCGGDL